MCCSPPTLSSRSAAAGFSRAPWRTCGDPLQKLRALPDETVLYCGHEYTLSNARFALTVDPGNAALQARAAEVEAQRGAHQFTLPVTLGAGEAREPVPARRRSGHRCQSRAGRLRSARRLHRAARAQEPGLRSGEAGSRELLEERARWECACSSPPRPSRRMSGPSRSGRLKHRIIAVAECAAWWPHEGLSARPSNSSVWPSRPDQDKVGNEGAAALLGPLGAGRLQAGLDPGHG